MASIAEMTILIAVLPAPEGFPRENIGKTNSARRPVQSKHPGLVVDDTRPVIRVAL